MLSSLTLPSIAGFILVLQFPPVVTLDPRPILSSTSTHAYALAKFLVPLLRLFSSGNYMVSDSFSFVNDLLSSNFSSDDLIMASFDIKSFFTNIPLDETIDIIVINYSLTPHIFLVLIAMILPNFYNYLFKIVIFYLTVSFTNK